MSDPYQQDPYSSPPQAPKKSNTTIIVVIVLACVSFFLLLCCGVLAGLLLPAVNQARDAARRATDGNAMKMIAMAVSEYEQTYKQFPPAYTVDENGNKLHSWRTLILPFLDESALYDQIDLSKPWDAPENTIARETEVAIFRPVSVDVASGHTLYRVIVHPQGIFNGPSSTTVASVTDGLSNTILFAQAGSDQSVPWMQPDEYSLTQFKSINSKNSPCNFGVSQISFADASTKTIKMQDLSAEQVDGMVTANGNESIMIP